MEDRKASWVAGALGCAAVGGFWLARPERTPAALRLLEQRNLPLSALDRDAAAAFRIELPRRVREAMDDSLPVVFRIVDREGRVYPLSAMHDPRGGSLKLPKGYPTDPVSPRLEAAVNGRPLASVALRPLPPPPSIPLVATPEAPFRLVNRGQAWLDAEPKGTIPKGERWRIIGRRTRFATEIDASADIPSYSYRRPSHRFALPFAEVAGLVEVDLVRYRPTPVSTVVRLSGLRLVRRFGGVGLVVDRSVVVDNALGARIIVPKQYIGPHRPLRRPDPLLASASLALAPPWYKETLRSPFPERERPPRIEILSPAPESLGLRELHIGPGLRRAASDDVGPLREGLFEATIRVTFLKPVPIDRRTYVVPVETGF